MFFVSVCICYGPKCVLELSHLVDTPRLVEPLRPTVVASVNSDIYLNCRADTEEMLDVAYIWSHNDIRIRDFDVKNSNGRLVSNRKQIEFFLIPSNYRESMGAI